MSKNPVLYKKDFVRRYASGEFGNRPPVWLTLEEFLSSGYVNPVHLRNRIAGGPTWYNIPAKKITTKWNELILGGISSKFLYISPMGPPDEERGLQGEVCRGSGGLWLTYSRIKGPMRNAMKMKTQHVSGVAALWLLREHLCFNSYEWLIELLDNYEDHVVEFTVYNRPWGILPGYNTVFWEVRKY